MESLRKGGGGGKGEVLADAATLAECGLTSSMGIYEHLWADSAANQALFWAEYEKMVSYVKTQVRNRRRGTVGCSPQGPRACDLARARSKRVATTHRLTPPPIPSSVTS